MEVIKYGKRTTIVTFDELVNYKTSVFIIECPKRIYIIDTFCGTKSMNEVIKIITNNEDKQIIVINTHSHWDHVWGNSVFKDEIIISCKLTRKYIIENWDDEYSKNKINIQGEAIQTLPNLTFQGKISFEEDGIEIFQAPGHTKDSISIYDRIENTLIVGDNLEKPIIYVENEDIQQYINTLKDYKKFENSKIFASHALGLNSADIDNTIDYLEGLREKREFNFQDEYVKKVHFSNRKYVK